MPKEKSGARQEAERIVDRYLKVIMSVQNDAGWQGDNILGRWHDFRGTIPQSSGFSGFSKVWEQTRALNEWPSSFIIAARLMGSLTPRQREALCIDRAYRGRTKVIMDPWVPGLETAPPMQVHWDDRRCANEMGCSIEAFRMRIKAGYKALEAIYSHSAARIAA